MVGCRGSQRVVNGLSYTVRCVDVGQYEEDADSEDSEEEDESKVVKTGRRVTLEAEDGEILVVGEDLFVKCLRLAYAVTCHCVQGLTITDERVWFMDAAGTYTTKRHYLVAISRVRDPRNLGIPTGPQQRELLSLGRV
jgi:hypothetical protein